MNLIIEYEPSRALPFVLWVDSHELHYSKQAEVQAFIDGLSIGAWQIGLTVENRTRFRFRIPE